MNDRKNLLETTICLPVLPLKNMAALPKSIIPIKVTRSVSLNAVRAANANHNGAIFLTSQSNLDAEIPEFSDLHKVGVRAHIVQTTTEKDGTLKILVEGVTRAHIVEEIENKGYLTAMIADLPVAKLDENLAKAMIRSIKVIFKEFATLGDKVAPELIKVVKDHTDLEGLIDTLAMQLNVDLGDRQKLLEEGDLQKRGIKICSLLQGEVEILKAEKNIKQRVQSQVEKHQRDYYLNEQVRAIYRELGREDGAQEIERFREQGRKLKMTAEALEKLNIECRRLEQMQSTSPEASVSRNYIEWLLAMPWGQQTKDKVTLSGAEKILEASHAGMMRAKERILEFVAAKKFAGDKLESAPIICLAGPPGVGKTSLAKAIAKALGRVFVRISLGGLRDEAEIRGHRRTYIGSMPGKLIHAIRKSKVLDPVILLDEVDKMSTDFRGDPSSALLEVLDPEQNQTFVDHFLEVGFDLSKVIFVTTANVYENIPYPLLDRMEVINLPGYTEEEKLQIAQQFLVPKIMAEHNLTPAQVKFSPQVIARVINEYTREAGVRQLGRILAKMTRKSIQKIMASNLKRVIIQPEDIEEWLGYPKFKPYVKSALQSVGVSTGLAWTEVGGDVLEVEVAQLKGKGGLTITGQLGEVMQESAQASLSYIRSKAKALGLKEDFYSDIDLHVHIPEGAIPKDGPSAGITMAVAMISVLTGIPVYRHVAMSGEITLQGRVLPVGGLREKLLAAIRLGLTKVIVPADNRSEIKSFEKELHGALELVYVETMDQVLAHALTSDVFAPRSAATKEAKEKKEKSAKTKKVVKKLTEDKKSKAPAKSKSPAVKIKKKSR